MIEPFLRRRVDREVLKNLDLPLLHQLENELEHIQKLSSSNLAIIRREIKKRNKAR